MENELVLSHSHVNLPRFTEVLYFLLRLRQCLIPEEIIKNELITRHAMSTKLFRVFGFVTSS